MEVVSTRAGTLPAPLETLRIGKPLGKGGFAVVRSGQLKTADGLAFPVAVKVLHPEFSEETCPELRLFREEAELMLKLNHRNITTAYGLLKLPPSFPGLEGHRAPAYALVLEFMQGGSLARIMVKQLLSGAVPKYTFSQALGWLIDVARALQHLHNGGKDGFPRIHRDVKLENVLLTAGMRTAKLADFGLQRAIFAQQPEHHQQVAMLVRRSMRPSITLPRGGPAGPSRLAPDSERTSLRQLSTPRLQQQLALASPESGSSAAVAAPPFGDCGDVTVGPVLTGGSDAVFFTVDNNGLTPLVLRNSPQKQPQRLSPADAAEAEARIDRTAASRLGPQPQAGCRLEVVGELVISRRSCSTPQLEQLECKQDPWPVALFAVLSSAREGSGAAAAAVQPPRAAAEGGGGGAVPGLLPRPDGAVCGSSKPEGSLSSGSLLHRAGASLQVVLPPSPVAPGSPSWRGQGTVRSQRSMLLGTAGSSPSAARPSPLGPMPSTQRPSSLPDCAPRLDINGFAGDSSRGQARAAAAGSPLGAARGLDAAEPRPVSPLGVPASPDDAACAPSAPLLTSVSVPCGSSAIASGRQSPGGLTPSAHDVHSPAQAAVEAAVRSRASLQDVILEPGAAAHPPPQQELHRRGPTLNPLPRPAAGQASSLWPCVAPAPGAVTGVGGAAAATGTAAASPGRLQVLTAADACNGEQGAGAPIPAGAAAALCGAVLRPTLPAAAGSAVPLVAVNSSARLDCLPAAPSSSATATTPRAGTASGMLADGDGGSGVGDVRSGNSRISVLAPASSQIAGGGRTTGGGDAAAATPAPAGSLPVSPRGSAQGPQQQQQLPMADLLHLRLGPQNVSVRSVRTSASGALNRHLVGSAPSSPKLAVAAAAAARAAAAGAWPQAQEATAMAQVVGPRSKRVGSLPGNLGPARAQSGGFKASAKMVDFEEVFSLTGRTGSLVYLAPEAYKNEPYNDKVDVYSLAVLMYELFGRTSISYTHISTKLPAFSRMLCKPEEFAERVAAGYRPPRTNTMAKLPPALWELIEASWHQDPVQRPDIGAVLQTLEELVEPVAEAEAGRGRRRLEQARCGCAIC